MKKYIVNYTNIPTAGHQYRITVEDPVSLKKVEEYHTWTPEQRDLLVNELNEKLGGAVVKEFIY